MKERVEASPALLAACSEERTKLRYRCAFSLSAGAGSPVTSGNYACRVGYSIGVFNNRQGRDGCLNRTPRSKARQDQRRGSEEGSPGQSAAFCEVDAW